MRVSKNLYIISQKCSKVMKSAQNLSNAGLETQPWPVIDWTELISYKSYIGGVKGRQIY